MLKGCYYFPLLELHAKYSFNMNSMWIEPTEIERKGKLFSKEESSFMKKADKPYHNYLVILFPICMLVQTKIYIQTVLSDVQNFACSMFCYYLTYFLSCNWKQIDLNQKIAFVSSSNFFMLNTQEVFCTFLGYVMLLNFSHCSLSWTEFRFVK